MIERVATKLAEDAQRVRGELREIQGLAHLPLPSLHWKLFEREARIAIEAMRECTGPMMQAGADASPMWQTLSPDTYAIAVNDVADVYVAMIDAALQEKEAGE